MGRVHPRLKVMKALIAGGPALDFAWGPLDHTCSRSLFPLGGAPLLAHALKFLRELGILEVILAIGLSAKMIIASLGSRPFGLRLHFPPGGRPNSLKDALRQAAPFLGQEPFFLYPEGFVFQEPPRLHLNSGAGKGKVLVFLGSPPSAAATLAATPRQPEEATVLYKDGRITGVGNGPGSDDAASGDDSLPLLPAGIFPSSILDFLPQIHLLWGTGPLVKFLLENGYPVNGQRLKGLPVRQPQDLFAAGRLFLEKMPNKIDGEIDPVCQTTGRIHLGEGAKVTGSILRGPLFIGPFCRVKDAYIGPNTYLEKGARVENAEVENSFLLEEASVRNLENRISDSIIGRGASIERTLSHPRVTKLIVGTGARIETV